MADWTCYCFQSSVISWEIAHFLHIGNFTFLSLLFSQHFWGCSEQVRACESSACRAHRPALMPSGSFLNTCKHWYVHMFLTVWTYDADQTTLSSPDVSPGRVDLFAVSLTARGIIWRIVLTLRFGDTCSGSVKLQFEERLQGLEEFDQCAMDSKRGWKGGFSLFGAAAHPACWYDPKCTVTLWASAKKTMKHYWLLLWLEIMTDPGLLWEAGTWKGQILHGAIKHTEVIV